MVKKHIYKNREEWLENRKNGLGGSDIACIIGKSSFKSNIDLYLEKIGEKEPDDLSGNMLVQYGSQAEKYLRELFILDFPQYEVFYEENNSFTNSKYPFAQASLDGWLKERETGRKGILEIKTATIQKSSDWEKWNEQVPMSYYCQCLYYLATYEADFCIIKAQIKHYTEDGELRVTTRHYHIKRSEVEEDIAYIMEKAGEFWDCVKNRRCPNRILPAI